MTPKQRRFAEEYLVDLNATQAAIRAGYSKKTAGQIGEENLRKPEIQNVIQAAIKARSEATGITAQNVLSDLRTLANMCLGKEPSPKCVVVEGAAVEASVKELNPAGAARALEMIGKHTGAFGRRIRLKTLNPSDPFKDQGGIVIKAVAAGEMSVEDGNALMQLIGGLTRLAEIDDHEDRIKGLETRLEEMRDAEKS